jgi:hypothetical protein
MASDVLVATSLFSLLCDVGTVPRVVDSTICLLNQWAGS